MQHTAFFADYAEIFGIFESLPALFAGKQILLLHKATGNQICCFIL
jgi:hypothetical protein